MSHSAALSTVPQFFLLAMLLWACSPVDISPFILYVPPLPEQYSIVHAHIYQSQNLQYQLTRPHNYYIQKLKDFGVSEPSSTTKTTKIIEDAPKVEFERQQVTVPKEMQPTVRPISDYVATRQIYPNAHPKDSSPVFTQLLQNHAAPVQSNVPPVPDLEPLLVENENKPDKNTAKPQARPQHTADNEHDKVVLKNSNNIPWKIVSVPHINPFVVENGVQITLTDSQTKSVTGPTAAPAVPSKPAQVERPAVPSQPVQVQKPAVPSVLPSSARPTPQLAKQRQPVNTLPPDNNKMSPIQRFPRKQVPVHRPGQQPKGVLIFVVCVVLIVGSCLVVFACRHKKQPIIANIQSKLEQFRHRQSQPLGSDDQDDDVMLESEVRRESKGRSRY